AAALAALVASLELENPDARRTAAAAVIAMDVPSARARIAQLALHDFDPEIRRVCAVVAPGPGA
ncbi:MAG: hypothetical protein H7138_06005, partial [Myxococcales bacterium]|nr:hypothetical protein [Myxococcales bacterium]